MTEQPGTPPGWYRDGAQKIRWWDGTVWGAEAPEQAPAAPAAAVAAQAQAPAVQPVLQQPVLQQPVVQQPVVQSAPAAVHCSACGVVLGAGARFCPACGSAAPAGAAAAPYPAAGPTAAGTAQFDLRPYLEKLGRGQSIVAGALVVLIISVPLPWIELKASVLGITIATKDYSGWAINGGKIAFLGSVALLVYLGVRLFAPMFAPSTQKRVPPWVILLIGTVLILFCTSGAIVSNLNDEGASAGFGAVLAIPAAIAAVVGSVLARWDIKAKQA